MSKTRYTPWLRVIIIFFFAVTITLLHFLTNTEHIHLHQIYQRSYYIPILLASYWFEILGGLATAVGLSIVYVVHISKHWAHSPVYAFEQYAEIAMYMVVAVLAGALSSIQRKARQRLEKAGRDLSQAYEKLNETFEQLKHSDRLASLGELSAGIAHEIRNPLGSIQGAVEILSGGLRPEDPKAEFAQIAKEEIAGLDKLVGEILAFSKPAPPRQMPTDVSEIIDGVCRLCADRARRQKTEIRTELDSPLPQALVDPEQIKQVLLNIIINAIQANPAGGTVLIRASHDPEDLIISVQDSGPGIKPEHLDRIFDPFFTTKREGTGLGLSISYQLVRNNGGQIRAVSEENKGACFLLRLPVIESESAGVNPEKKKVKSSAEET